MSDNPYYVYVLFRPWDGSPFYVGKGKGYRISQTVKETRNPHKVNIIAKARKMGMEIPNVIIRDELTEREAFEIEIAFIKAIGRTPNGPLTNCTDGGEGISGHIHSSDAKAKISAAGMGRKHSDERRARASISRKGEKRSDEARARMSAAQKTRPPMSDETRAKISAASRNISDETRARIGAAHKGRIFSADHLAKINAANTGKKRSAESRERMSLAHKGKQLSDEHRSKIRDAHLARTSSPEVRLRMSEAAKKAWAIKKAGI